MIKKISVYITIIIFLILLFTLSSCGRGGAPSSTENASNEQTLNENVSTENMHASSTGIHTPSEYVLTAFIPGRFRNMFDAAARRMQEQKQESGNSFRLEITHFRPAEHESMLMRLQTMLMAGQSYDLMILEGQPFYAMAETGFLADFYQMIDNCLIVSRDDFFTQALEAFEFRGGLYALPLNFGFEYVGINSGLPPSIISRFAQYSGVSLTQLLSIYLDLVNNYPQYRHLQFGPYFELDRVIRFEMSSHIDVDNRLSRLADGDFALFLEKLAEARQINPDNFTLHPDGHTGYATRGHGFFIHKPIHLEAMAGQFAFINHRHRMDPLVALLDYENPVFTYYVPLTDNLGRLKIDHTPWCPMSFPEGGMGQSNGMNSSSTIGTVMVSSAADLDLAWDMVRHLISFIGTAIDVPLMRRGFMDLCMSTPIMHTLFDAHYDTTMILQLHVGWYFGSFGYTALQRTANRWLDSERELSLTPAALTQIDNMKERIRGYTEMPMSIPLFHLPPSLYESAIDHLVLGIISPQAAAHEIHNRVTLWLIE